MWKVISSLPYFESDPALKSDQVEAVVREHKLELILDEPGIFRDVIFNRVFATHRWEGIADSELIDQVIGELLAAHG